MVVCTTAQTSELTLEREQPREVAPLVFNTFRKISTSSEQATRDEHDAEGRVLFQTSTDVQCFQKHSVRPVRLIDVDSETSPNFDADWRELSGYEEEDRKAPTHYACIGLHSGFYCP